MNLAQPTHQAPDCCRPSESNPTTLRPATSFQQDEHGARLRVALPGVPKQELKLSVNQGILSVEATRSGLDSPIRYSLSVKLDERLDENSIQANLEDGVLHASIPLKEESKPKLIPIV